MANPIIELLVESIFRIETRSNVVVSLGLVAIAALGAFAHRWAMIAEENAASSLKILARARQIDDLRTTILAADSAIDAYARDRSPSSRARYLEARFATFARIERLRRVDPAWPRRLTDELERTLPSLDTRTNVSDATLPKPPRPATSPIAVRQAPDRLLGVLDRRSRTLIETAYRFASEARAARSRSAIAGPVVAALALALAAVGGLQAMRGARYRDRTEIRLLRHEALLAHAAKAGNVGTWEFDPLTNRFAWSDRCRRILELDSSPATSHLADLRPLLGQDFDQIETALSDAACRGISFLASARITREPDPAKHVIWTGGPVRDGRGRHLAIVGAIADVSETRRLEERLELFNAVAECAECEIAMLDSEGRSLFANQRLRATTERDSEELIGRIPWDVMSGPETDADSVRALRTAVANRRGAAVELVWYTKSGRPFWTLCHLTPIPDGATKSARFVLTATDVTERKITEQELVNQRQLIQAYGEESERQKAELAAANERLRVLATSDGLTGLANHRAFQDRLEAEFSRGRRSDDGVALLLIDVDHFKSYNDSFGHPAGDEVLRTVADIVRAQVRSYDLPARYGGEEFAVVLPATDAEGATAFAERIRRAIESHEWELRPITVSVGVSVSDGASSRRDLIRIADEALYEAKAAGRNRVVLAGRTASDAA